MLRPILLALLAFAVATPAHADSRQELHSAFSNNLKLKSYKATMTDLITRGFPDKMSSRRLALYLRDTQSQKRRDSEREDVAWGSASPRGRPAECLGVCF